MVGTVCLKNRWLYVVEIFYRSDKAEKSVKLSASVFSLLIKTLLGRAPPLILSFQHYLSSGPSEELFTPNPAEALSYSYNSNNLIVVALPKEKKFNVNSNAMQLNQ